jgi:hypothetical protein
MWDGPEYRWTSAWFFDTATQAFKSILHFTKNKQDQVMNVIFAISVLY